MQSAGCTTNGACQGIRTGHARSILLAVIALALIALPAAVWAQGSGGTSTDWSQVRRTIGFTGKTASSGVLQITFSRENLSITEHDESVSPGLVADSTISIYAPNSSGMAGSSNGKVLALITGEVPLLETEVQTFVKDLQSSGLDISAIHNHELEENPRLIFVHVEFTGDAVQFASAFRTALDHTGGSFKEDTNENTSVKGLSRSQIAATLGHGAQVEGKGDVVEATINRTETFSNCALAVAQANGGLNGFASGSSASGSSTPQAGAGTAALTSCLTSALTQMGGGTGTTGGTGGAAASGSSFSNKAGGLNAFPPEMGATHDVHFQSMGSGKTAVDAEFALLATEVNPAIKILKKAGFDINAVHNHFLNESPRLFFLHAGATGDAMTLAKAVRQVLDQNAALAGPFATR